MFLKVNIQTKENNFNVLLDADPRSVLCVFFKQGQCMKGDRCKFSHDLSLERKTEKRNLYVDSRDVTLENGEDHITNYQCALNKMFGY